MVRRYSTYTAGITYSRDGNASLIRSEGFALISHTQVMLSCISFIGGFLIFPGALVITPPQRDLSKRRKKHDSKTVQDHTSQPADTGVRKVHKAPPLAKGQQAVKGS